ncbi:MAG: hypothetical protein GTO03_00985 [Planctomycetales bacterium]|nr:hypothetical protein [Planctomycetales bacterium]
MTFTFPSLFYIWLLPLVALPVLIHLINLLRHRRVSWAAMEFLLESKKKHQNWIRLKQLLLLLARMTAVALIVFMMAGPLLQDQWSRLFGGGKTHHVILLDDSGSMADRWADTSAFGRAQDVVRGIVARADRQSTQQFVTLLTFSRAAAGQPPEILRTLVTTEFAVEFDSYQNGLAVTQLSSGPREALEAVEKLLQPDEDENVVVYLVSDLRSAQWSDTTALRQSCARLHDQEAQLQLVHCVDAARPNLAITQLGPTPGQQATDVLIRLEVEVTNFGTQTARNVSVQLRKRAFADADDTEGTVTTLGAVTFDRLEPARPVRRSFDVTFDRPGHHEITARLPGDPLAADNRRFCVVAVLPEVPVLIVDGGGPDDPIFLKTALAPSPRIRTGLRPRIAPPTVLRDLPLDPFHAIYLLNIHQLDQVEVEALEAYVRGGGGVVFFAGDATRRDLINNQLYREGEGLFPVRLAAPSTLLIDRLENAPDVTVDHQHPIFQRTFADKYNTWLQKIMVERYFSVAQPFAQADDPNVSVLARLRDGAPLIVEKKFGQGRVLAVLTTAAPLWHNWGLANPTFIVAMLETQVYLGSFQQADVQRQVGQPLDLQLPPADYLPDVTLVVPRADQRQTLSTQATPSDPPSQVLQLRLEATTHSGLYEARLTRSDGQAEARRFAYNVSSVESDLSTVFRPQLQSLLGDVPFQYREATELLAPPGEEAGFALAEQWWFFIGLIGLLVAEQLLAYSATYHPPLTGDARR